MTTLPYWLDLNEDRPNRHGNPILASWPDPDRIHGGHPTDMAYAVGGLHYLKGNRRPHFSLTLDARDRGGCAHDEILAHAPQLAPLAALHLSDDDGRPMHAAENGFYWFAGYAGGVGEQFYGGNGTPEKSLEDCLRIWADHVRLPIGEARRAADSILKRGFAIAKESGYRVGDRDVHAQKCESNAIRALHAEFIEAQTERWRREAAACIEALGIRFYYGDRWESAAE